MVKWLLGTEECSEAALAHQTGGGGGRRRDEAGEMEA